MSSGCPLHPPTPSSWGLLCSPCLGLGGALCLLPAHLGVNPLLGVMAAHPRDRCPPQRPWAITIFTRSSVHGFPAAVLGSSALHLSAVSCLREAEGFSWQPEGRAGQAQGCVFAGDFLRRRCPGGDDAAWTLIKWLWGRMSCWPVPYSRRSFLCRPQRSWLWEVVGEGLTFSWLSLARRVAGALAQPHVPHGAVGGAPPNLLSLLWGPPHLPQHFLGGFLLFPGVTPVSLGV